MVCKTKALCVRYYDDSKGHKSGLSCPPTYSPLYFRLQIQPFRKSTYRISWMTLPLCVVLLEGENRIVELLWETEHWKSPSKWIRVDSLALKGGDHLWWKIVLFYTVVSWGSKISAADTNRINKLKDWIHIGCAIRLSLTLAEVTKWRMMQKLIMNNNTHHFITQYSEKALLSLWQSNLITTPRFALKGSLQLKCYSFLSQYMFAHM